MTDYDIDMDRWHEPAEDDLAEALPGAACRRAPRAPVGRGRERVLAPREPEPSTLLDTMDQYIRSLGAPRVLTKEETFELAREIEAARTDFLGEIYPTPGTAVKLEERWSERRRAGRVTGLLSAHHPDRSGKDWSPQIDRALGRLARLLARRERPVGDKGCAAAREREALDGQIARTTEAAQVSFAVLHDIYRELRALRAAPRTRATREARRRLGLDDLANRARLERAGRALARMDRFKQDFVVHNLRLVMKQAKRFRHMGVPYVDLVQEGNLGLIRAVEKFDYRLGYRFSTYAVWWIDQALVRAVQNTSRTVRVPSHVYDLAIRLRRVREQLRTKLARAPTHEELASALGVTAVEVEKATRALQPVSSTQATLRGTEEFTLEDALADEDAADPVEAIEYGELGLQLGRKLAVLPARERGIIDARFGLSGADPLTLQEIGDRMGLSRERVRQLESRALARLREEAPALGGWERT